MGPRSALDILIEPFRSPVALPLGRSPPTAPSPPRTPSLAAIGLIVGSVSAAAAPRIATPITVFAGAAERRGVDARAPALVKCGPLWSCESPSARSTERRFYRPGRSRNRETRGAGLGPSVARSREARHHLTDLEGPGLRVRM
jgi:hypothetical protein